MASLQNILKSLGDLFFSSSSSSWDLYRLKTELVKASQNSVYPALSSLPPVIYLHTAFWKEIRSVFDLTVKDEHERELSIWYVDGDLVFTKVVRGERSQVISKHGINVRYIPQKGTEYYTKEIKVDGHVYSNLSVHRNNLPKKIDIAYLFRLHTHPPHFYNGSGRVEDRYYNFFSLTDIKSFLKSKIAATGLVTDRFWFLYKTNQSPRTIGDDDQILTPKSLVERYKFGLYSSDFKTGKLVLYQDEKAASNSLKT